MKRLHIHIKTKDLEQSAAFYTALFGQAPTVRKTDYAKWLLDDPAANVAVSTHSENVGVAHVGVSVDEKDDLDAMAARLEKASAPLAPEEATTCCYARSDKYWTTDPQGAVWELFRTFGESETYGADPNLEAVVRDAPAPCCGV